MTKKQLIGSLTRDIASLKYRVELLEADKREKEFKENPNQYLRLFGRTDLPSARDLNNNYIGTAMPEKNNIYSVHGVNYRFDGELLIKIN